MSPFLKMQESQKDVESKKSSVTERKETSKKQSGFSRRTKVILGISIALAILIAVSIIISVFFFSKKEEGKTETEALKSVETSRPATISTTPETSQIRIENVCRTEECVKLSKRMRSFMNSKIDPCDDFYESVCGNYPKNGSNEELDNENEDIEDLAKLIKTYKPTTENEYIAMTVLERCMDKTDNRIRFNTSFWDNLKSHSLTDVLIEAAKTDPIGTGFVQNYVDMVHDATLRPNKRLIVVISQGTEKNPKLNQLYEKIGKENNLLEEELLTLDSAKQRIKFMNLPKYVNSLVPEEQRGLAGDGEWYVVVNELLILEKIVNISGVENVKNIIRDKWRSTMDKYLVKPTFSNCFNTLEKLFPGTLATIFVKNFVGDKNLFKGNELFKDLQKTFIEMIDENDWIETPLKNALKQEVLDMKSSIGIPDEHKNQEHIDEMYLRIGDYESQNYLDLIQNILKMNSEETFLRVAKKEGITYHGETTRTNANYLPKSHRTTISPMFLNYPYIDKNLPEWNTIASIGSIMAHEIGHAFDAFDFYKSPMRTNHEMSTKMNQTFKDRIDCVIQKYNKYKFTDGSFSNGTLTQQEDSADMIGFNLAYRLFKTLENQKKLPSLEKYSIEQQYFQRIGFFWCTSEMDEKALKYAKGDIHSFEKFRVNGMMSNSEEFAKAFNCPKNSPMNPEKKCPLFK